MTPTTPLVKKIQQSSRLALLPKELVDNIASWLPTQDINVLRLTCKDVESKSFKYWSEYFFKKKQFMIDQFSLQTLVDISKHDALSKIMTHLVIGLDELQASHRLSHVDSVAQFSQWRDADCAQKALLYGGGAADLLSTALANLPRLETIDIRDFDSSSRFRDAVPGREAPRWRSYGSSRYQQWPRETNWLIRVSGSKTHFVDTVFTMVLAAVGRSSTAVKNLEVMLRNRQVCLQDEAFSTLCIPGTSLANVLPALTKLHLDLDSRGSAAYLSHIQLPHLNVPQHAWFDPCTEYLRRFLALTPNVSWLRLNFQFHGSNVLYSSSKLMEWLSLRPGFNAPPDAPWGEGNPAPITLPLHRLDLKNVTTSLAILHALLKKFADLKHIVMRDVRLQSPAGTPAQDDDSTDCVWARLIRSLNVTNPKLKKLELDRITEDAAAIDTPVVFLDKHDEKQVSHSTSTQFDDNHTVGDLADYTWTTTRWGKVYAPSDESAMDEDSFDELSDEDDDGDEDEGLE